MFPWIKRFPVIKINNVDKVPLIELLSGFKAVFYQLFLVNKLFILIKQILLNKLLFSIKKMYGMVPLDKAFLLYRMLYPMTKL